MKEFGFSQTETLYVIYPIMKQQVVIITVNHKVKVLRFLNFP